MAEIPDVEQLQRAFNDRTLAHAIGGAICVVGAVLQREGVIRLDDLGHHMALFAAVSAESDEDTALLVAHWASMLKSIALPTESPSRPKL